MPTDMEFMNRLFHDALRRDLDRMIRALTMAPARPTSQRTAFAEHVTLVLDLLHHHHTGEDQGLWPLVRRRAGPRCSTRRDGGRTRIGGAVDRVHPRGGRSLRNS
jgi:hypothetical protein